MEYNKKNINMVKFEIDKLDKSWVATLVTEGYTTYDIVSNYEIPEEIILDCDDLLDKYVLISYFNFSENFINEALETEYFSLEDIKELNMKTYSNLSTEFILKYGEYINWNRMILYISAQSLSIDEYIDIIDNQDLWDIISANDLPIEFIRQWKDKLNWKYLSIVKEFTNDEKEEFNNHIVVTEENVGDPFVDTNTFKFLDKMSSEELEELITRIQEKLNY